MNKTILLATVLITIVAAACKTTVKSANTNVAKIVADEVIAVDAAVNAHLFQFLDDSLEGKDIVILGEASHGDGKTFEVKSQLVKYLIEQKGYNTFAFEQRDFFEMEYVNGRKSLQGVLDESLKHNWVRQWSPWGPAKEIQTLVDVLETHNLGYVGLETYSSRSISRVIVHTMKTAKALSLNYLTDEEWEQLNYIHVYMNAAGQKPVTGEQFSFYINTFEKLLNKLPQSEDNEVEFLHLIIENAVTSAKITQLVPAQLTDEEYYKSVNLRDSQMAKNLIWYKKNNPDAKIIVWMANFHGAKNIREVHNPLTYNRFYVFGEHVANRYGSKIYSIAFTSSRGTSKMPYNNKSNEETVINAPEGSFENYLDTKNIDFGYVNFSEIGKNNPGLINKEFSSIMLGYANQSGKWLNIFDGVFYIKENHNATPIR